MKVINVDIKPMVNVLFQEWHKEEKEDNRKPLNRKENIKRIKDKLIAVSGEQFSNEYINKITIIKAEKIARIELNNNTDLQEIYKTCDSLNHADLFAYYSIV